MKKYILLVHFLFITYGSFSQTVIQMKKEGGVSIIPCKVNGLSLSFIFDTGASDVSISLTEAKFMFKNGYLTKDDMIGTSKYVDANGDISEGININLREIEIQGLKLFNVKASIVKNSEAPLLLGRTAIDKLGIFYIDPVNNTITITSKTKEVSDYDGNYYKTIKIGTNVWISKNLNVSHFRNGDTIVEIKNYNAWNNALKNHLPAWCYYNYDNRNLSFGKIYNYFAVKDKRGIVPKGFHISTDNEFDQIHTFCLNDKNIFVFLEKNGFNISYGGSGQEGIFNGINNFESWWVTLISDQLTLGEFSLNKESNLYNFSAFTDDSHGCYLRAVMDNN